jgi:cytochrome oxidase Cu insertion factor (SCO1/SenC/PrrC family)
MTTSEPSRKPNRRQIWVLIAVFFAPLAVAFLLYYGVEGWRPHGNTNNGELIAPRPLPQLALPTAQGAMTDAELLRGKWSLIYVGDGACDARCREALVLIRQTRLSLNDDMSRIQRIFLATGTCCDQPYLDREHKGVITIRADDPDAARLLQEFPLYDAVPLPQAGRIYIVDPLGNLMMSYSPQARPKGLLEDLKKLLRLSHIG